MLWPKPNSTFGPGFRDQFTPAQEAEMEAGQAAAENEPLGTCVVHGDYWTDDCPRCDWGE